MNSYDDMPSAPGIYCAVNTVNHKIYVGKSDCICARVLTHVQQLRLGNHPNKAWQRDWVYYGETAFEWSVLAADKVFNGMRRPSLLDIEAIFIHAYQAKNPEAGYNTPASPRKRPEPIDPLDDAANAAARLYRPDAVAALCGRLTWLELSAT